MEIDITEKDLRAAMAAGIITQSQLTMLVAFLNARPASSSPKSCDQSGVSVRSRFDLSHVLWYAGSLVVIGAMGMFSTLGFSLMGGTFLTASALVYACLFVGAGYFLWYKKDLFVPGGLLVSIAVCMVPLAVYGIQSQAALWGAGGNPAKYRDFFEWIQSSWVYMEFATLVAGAIALWFFPFPFIVAVMGTDAWFLSMDIARWIYGYDDLFDGFEARLHFISIAFGIVMLVLAGVVDKWCYKAGDFAFWLHLFGLMMLWCTLTRADFLASDHLNNIYCLVNIILVGFSLFFMRPVYAVFGAIGIALYLSDVSGRLFRDSLYFPFALSLIGVGIIAMGLVYHRQKDVCAAWLAAHLPAFVQNLRPAHARSGG